MLSLTSPKLSRGVMPTDAFTGASRLHQGFDFENSLPVANLTAVATASFATIVYIPSYPPSLSRTELESLGNGKIDGRSLEPLADDQEIKRRHILLAARANNILLAGKHKKKRSEGKYRFYRFLERKGSRAR